MANQIDPITIDAVLALAQRKWSHRRIATELDLDRGTVARYVQVSKAGIPTAIWKSLPYPSVVAENCGAAKGRKSSISPALREVIQARLNSGTTLKDIHGELTASHNFLGSYYSVLRIARRMKRNPKARLLQHRAWMTAVFQGTKTFESLQEELKDISNLRNLLTITRNGKLKARNKALTVLAHHKGISNSQIAQFLDLARETTKRYCTLFASDPKALFTPRRRFNKKMDDPKNVAAVVSTLHSPPRAYGINRTTWKQDDLHRVLKEKGISVSPRTIRAILKKQGFRWRKARKVLTSKDPAYREKVEKITTILANIGERTILFD